MKALLFTVTVLVVALAPGLLLSHFLPTSWGWMLLRVAFGLLWGYAVGSGFAIYLRRRLRP